MEGDLAVKPARTINVETRDFEPLAAPDVDLLSEKVKNVSILLIPTRSMIISLHVVSQVSTFLGLELQALTVL